MGRKAIPEKIKKKIYQEAGMACPFCGETDVTTFELHHIQPYSEIQEHKEDNLILLCSNCHAKVTAGEISEIEVLRKKISLIKGVNSALPNQSQLGNVISFDSSVNNGVVANRVEIKTQKKSVKVNAPVGSIASSANHRNYIKRLIDRYHEFKTADVGKEKMKYTIIYGAINREFGAKWDMIALSQFEKLVNFMHRRIDSTILGKNKKSKNIKRYSTYEEFLQKYGS
ncbi:MAG: HNH endonuclease [Halarcobacter sp.]